MKVKKKALPLCPNPEIYIVVHTKERSFWLRKRGSVKPAALNNAFKSTANNAAISGPIAKRICQKLKPFTDGLDTGRKTIAIINLLNKSMVKNAAIDYSFFTNYEFQKRYPLNALLEAGYRLMITGNTNIADKETALQNGVDVFLAKPFSKDEIQIFFRNYC